jgi:agmatine deiminase
MTPKSQGYRFPAEWERHESTWLTFPTNRDTWEGDKLEKIYPAYLDFIKAIAEGEKVNVIVPTAEFGAWVIEEIRQRKGKSDQVIPHLVASNDAWCRDHGPAFLINPEAEVKRLIVDWEYNAWGGKYPPFDADNQIPNYIANYLNTPSVSPQIIMEGGSVEFNGAGTVLTSRACLLNPNRNPQLNQAQIEQYLYDYYGVEQILWVNDGIVGDDTDGHIDDTVRFVNADTVVAVTEQNKQDANYPLLQENLHLLHEMRLLNGKPLNIVELPMPTPFYTDDLRLPASYANFYIANAAVIVPTFACKEDEIALKILTQCFKDRPVIGIDARAIIWGLGSFHCLSQQEPAV